jgi:8-oxo-dGTP diphosphatase
VRDLADFLWRTALRAAYRCLRLYWFVFRPRTEGVYVAIWHRGRILLVENSYRRRRTLPAGRLKRGEDPAQGAVRELREEVGIELEPQQLRYFGEFRSEEDYARDRARFYEFEFESEPALRVDRREVIAAYFCTPQEALAAGPVAVLGDYLRRVTGAS